jgi:predicted Zn-dependent protease
MKGTTASKLGRRQGKNWRRLIVFGVAIATSVLVIFTHLQPVKAQNGLLAWSKQKFQLRSPSSLVVAAESSLSSLPTPQSHPLPTPLAQWQDTTGTGDYFSEVKLTPVGYLVWSQFPIKIYVEQPTDSTESPSSLQRFQNWVDAVLQAVREWSVYLPLEVVAQPAAADISILRSRPPLQASLNRETGKLNLPRARSAQTRYEFYLRPAVEAAEEVLSHRFTIKLSPDQTVEYTIATARHELGHALGIWGHSPLETDTMYFSQVRNSPQISARDINTLKRIYEQPTPLGWPLTKKLGFKPRPSTGSGTPSRAALFMV